MNDEKKPTQNPFDLIFLYTKNVYKALLFLVVYFACIQYLSQGTTQNSMSIGIIILVNIFCAITSLVLFLFFIKKIKQKMNDKKVVRTEKTKLDLTNVPKAKNSKSLK